MYSMLARKSVNKVTCKVFLSFIVTHGIQREEVQF